MAARLALRGITKRFAAVLANDAIDIEVAPGAIHALLGENGAGKSTLVKIVYGVLHADSGQVLWNGEPARIATPAAARRLGIGMVFQNFSLFESLTVAENIALGLDRPGPLPALARRVGEVAQRYGLAVDPARPVHTLSTGERQRVEIARCLLQDPQLIIMDEPTSVLTPQEAERLFETLRRLAGEGRSILYISHKLDEIRVLCSRATILRQGRVVAEVDPRAETAATLAAHMIGRTVKAPSPRSHSRGRERFIAEQLTLPPADPFGVALDGIGFAVAGGEILGIAGVAGNGQAELMAVLAGERSSAATAVRLDGRPVGRLGPAERRRLGLAVIPEERVGTGTVPELTLADNTVLTNWRRLAAAGLVRPAAARRYAEAVIRDYGVVTRGPLALARSLSGGNLQKFIVGREIMQEPGVLVAAAPTWGVDAGAAVAVHQALLDLAARGVAIVVVSQDLDELFAIADRMAVIFRGRLSQAQPTRDLTLEQVGLLMGGEAAPSLATARHAG